MLSRISTKLPNFFQNKSETTVIASREEVDQAIAEIKSLGKQADGGGPSYDGIGRILALMSKYTGSLHVQRVACHAASNLAMQVGAARFIIDQGGFELISKAIRRYPSDFKLHWLASSAIWNLARPPVNRAKIGSAGVSMMFEILKRHDHREKVANTAIGALSNLSLDDDLKNQIAHESKSILDVLRTHRSLKSMTVCTSGAGLLANLAVNDTHASMLVQNGALPILMEFLSWHEDNPDVQGSANDETLFRNSCAALNNLVTANGFLKAFLRDQGLEKVYKFLSIHKSNELYANLLENVLVNIDADREIETTSLHLACLHGDSCLEIVKSIVDRNDLNGSTLDELDGHGMCALDYAVSHDSTEIASFLCRMGANPSIMRTNESTISTEMKNAMESSMDQLKEVKSNVQKALVETLPHVPVDLCRFMVKFQSNADMLKGMDLY